MTLNKLKVILIVSLLLNSVTPILHAQVNVTTYHNDNARTGQNIHETVLTTANVNPSSFGRLFSVPVDGYVYAQPLLLSNVTIGVGGGTHNVVYVATENNSLYAIDADNGTKYWQKSLMTQGEVPVPYTDLCQQTFNIVPQIGITSTPVIDTTTNTIYVVTSTKQSGNYYERLHARDVVTGNENVPPVAISASYNGATFNAYHQLNRPGLLLVNGHVIVAFGQHCNNEGYGWVMSYKAADLSLEAVYNTDPLSIHGSVWMSGAGVASDSTGNLFFATGDGYFDGASYFGDSIIKLGPPLQGSLVFPFRDSFTPSNQDDLDRCDLDLGSGGVLLLPDLPFTSQHPHLLVQAGKEGTIYLVNRDTGKMGEYCGDGCTDQIVQELPSAVLGVWGMPAYWNGNVYFGSANQAGQSCQSGMPGQIASFSFNASGSGLLSSTPTHRTTESFVWPGATPSVSSNGTTNGIVWALDNSSYPSSCCAVLYAYNATSLTDLYNSNEFPEDQAGGAVKFSVPTVANGKVYVGGQQQITVYGELAVQRCISQPQCFGSGQFFVAVETLSCPQPHNISTEAQACNPSCNTGYGAAGYLTNSSANAQNNAYGGASCNLYWSIDGQQFSKTLHP